MSFGPIGNTGDVFGGGFGGFGGGGGLGGGFLGGILAAALFRGGLFGRDGMGGAAVAAEVGALPAIANLTSAVGNIQGKLSESEINGNFRCLPGETAAATKAALCEPLCGIEAALADKPNNAAIAASFAYTNGLVNGLDRAVERNTFGLTTQINAVGNQLSTQGAQQFSATTSQIDNKFCQLQNDLERSSCQTNALIAAEGNSTRSLMREIQVQDLLAGRDARIALLEREAMNNVIVGNNNNVQQGLVNINNNLSSIASGISTLINHNSNTNVNINELVNNTRALARSVAVPAATATT